jgi:Ser/Thr protein kinase RdoA (MazF antagonist)
MLRTIGWTLRRFHDAASAIYLDAEHDAQLPKSRFGLGFGDESDLRKLNSPLPSECRVMKEFRMRTSAPAFVEIYQHSGFGCIHGDVKQSNIVWDHNNDPKFIDLELVGRGRRLWDLFFFCAEYLKDCPQEECRTAVTALISGYRGAEFGWNYSVATAVMLTMLILRTCEDSNIHPWVELAERLIRADV